MAENNETNIVSTFRPIIWYTMCKIHRFFYIFQYKCYECRNSHVTLVGITRFRRHMRLAHLINEISMDAARACRIEQQQQPIRAPERHQSSSQGINLSGHEFMSLLGQINNTIQTNTERNMSMVFNATGAISYYTDMRAASLNPTENTRRVAAPLNNNQYNVHLPNAQYLALGQHSIAPNTQYYPPVTHAYQPPVPPVCQPMQIESNILQPIDSMYIKLFNFNQFFQSIFNH